jgi:MFS transporter, FSR family, fosmidomycin resistance protein
VPDVPWPAAAHTSSALGGLALTLELAGGVLGTLVGDRFGSVRTIQIGNTLLVPALVAVLACHDKYGASR